MVKIGGFQKNSFIDYPGKISCVIFLTGCNFTCPYCHNPELARGETPESHTLEEIRDFLSARKGLIDGVVISGGEPTLQTNLPNLCESIRKLGFPVKLDTNGSRPEMLKQLIRKEVIDYIAMDIKTDPFQYAPVFHPENQSEAILESMKLIQESGLPHEFRTTCCKPIITGAVIETIARRLLRSDRYVLQRFHPNRVLNPDFFRRIPGEISPVEINEWKQIAAKYGSEVEIR